MSELPVSVRLSIPRVVGALVVLGIGLVVLARPVESSPLRVVVPDSFQPVSNTELPISDASTYTAPSSYHTGPTQGAG
jgi:hypothetical protein